MPTPNLTGQQIHHYEILSHLGGGGMGVVYKARDTKLGRTVALKFLAPQLTSDPDLKKRFVQEAKAASALDHPNIGVVHDINETQDGQLFITMAYYEGETLKDKIAQGPIPTEQAVDYAAQIAKGLAKAHEADIVHRDIKPANIIITKDNTVKIVDFGLAKMTGETQLTKTGSTIGTIAYMSPEQLKGEEVDHRTDIWSLGVVLYEMVMGVRPYKGEYEHQIIYQVMHDEVDLGRVPAEVRPLIQGALQKEPDKRYQRVYEFLAELGRGVSSSDKSPRKPFRRSKKNKPLVWIAVPLLVIGVVTALYLALTGLSKNAPAEAPVAIETQLTYSGDAYNPAISPDGELIAYFEEDGPSYGRSGRMVMRETEGGQPIKIYPVDGDTLSSGGRPRSVWSPDGTMLAVVVFVTDPLIKDDPLLIFSRLGAHIKTVRVYGERFAWSPDSKSIATFTEEELRIIDLATLEVETTPFPISFAAARFIEWSPNGDFFVVETNDSTGHNIWTMGRDAKNPILIYEADEFTYGPQWDKKGEHVYFFEMNSEKAIVELWKIPVSPLTGEKRGEPILIRSPFRYSSGISITEDNKRSVHDGDPLIINFWKFDLQNIDQSPEAVKLTSTTSFKTGHKISPDGSSIAFMMQSPQGINLYSIPIEGGTATQRTFLAEGDIKLTSNLDWSPDGERIVIQTYEDETSLLYDVTLSSGHVSRYELPTVGLHSGTGAMTRTIAYGAEGRVAYVSADSKQLVVFDLDTQEATYASSPDSGHIASVTFSPDGYKLGYSSSIPYELGECGVWVWDTVSNDSQCIFQTEERLGALLWSFRWSSDGNWIYASSLGHSVGEANQRIVKIASDGSGLGELGSIDAYAPGLQDISPDGSVIIEVRQETSSDLFMLEHFDPDVE